MIITIGKLFLLCMFGNLRADTLQISHRAPDARPYIAAHVMVDKKQVVVGEPVAFKLRVVYDPRTYTMTNILPPTLLDASLEFLQKSQKEPQTVQGMQCHVYEVEGVFYPHKAGALQIDPFHIKADQRVATARSFMGLVMNSSISMYSNALTLQVQPLPPTHVKTHGFVGDFTGVTLEVDKTSFAAGDAIMVKYHLQGVGNAVLCAHPPLRLPEMFKWYPAESKKERDGHCFEYALQATGDGDLLIPAQSFIYFNCSSGKYQELKTLPFWVHVSPSVHAQRADQEADQEVEEPVITDLVQQEPVEEQDSIATTSLLRTLYIPDALFGFLLAVGLLAVCVQQMGAWSIAQMQAVRAWWRYRRLLARAAHAVKKINRREDIEHQDVKDLYLSFKELQSMVDWKRRENNKQKEENWHIFWQRMECARFDADRSGALEQHFVHEAQQWITYFEKCL